MFDIDSNERVINLCEEININSVKTVMDKILSITAKYDVKINTEKNFIPKPILLYINTMGGSIYDAMALTDLIEISKYPIYTICTGYCMSAGIPIYLAGHKRFCTKNSQFMIHQTMPGMFGTLNKFTDAVDDFSHTQNVVDKHITDSTNIMKSQLKEVYSKNKDWVIYSDEAVKLGIADKVLTNKDNDLD